MIYRVVVVLALCVVSACTSYERFQAVLQERGQATCVCFEGNAMSYVRVKGYAVRGGGEDIEAIEEMLKECKDFC